LRDENDQRNFTFHGGATIMRCLFSSSAMAIEGALQQAITQAAQGSPPSPVMVASMETALTTALERYLSDLHTGRIDPKRIHHNYHGPRPDGFEPAAYLRTAVAERRLAEAAQEAEPGLPLYPRLREALRPYRERVGHPAWPQPLPPLPGGKVAPGHRYAGLAMLGQRLAELGDLAPDTPTPARYEALLVNAVKAFQRRHGLAADGVVGKATLAQLQVTPAARVRQIELMLERLRWTPLTQGPRMIVINIPEFVLRAYEVQGDRIHMQQEMKVIVGKSLETRTPLFDEDMRFIEFSPYWNIPPSIARAETVPNLRRDPGYLAREEMEFVSANSRVDRTVSAGQLNAVLAGKSRIRQRPGPKNALGDIKFVLPNHDNIYLHHTPVTQLFERDRRDFSHGCIRQAMSRGESATLRPWPCRHCWFLPPGLRCRICANWRWCIPTRTKRSTWCMPAVNATFPRHWDGSTVSCATTTPARHRGDGPADLRPAAPRSTASGQQGFI
jgi:murein L,D-transpeptidase YcbB/YkuD